MINYLRLKEVFLSTGLLFLSTGLLISGSGMMNTLLSLKLKLDGKSSELVGIISGVYFTGILLGSLKAAVFIKLVGYVKSFSTFAAIMAIATILPGIDDNIHIWFICRFIQGICLAILYVVIESWILCASSENNRGKNLAMYMVVLYGTYSLGQFFLLENAVSTIIPFCISTILITASIIPISSFPVTPPILEDHEAIKLKTIFKASPSGFIGCVISGIIISAIYSIFPLYIEEVTSSNKQIAVVIATTFLAGVLMQYPLGTLSDKIDRQKIQIILNTTFSVLLAIFTFLEYNKSVDFQIMIIIAAAIGIFAFTIYPISINLVCDNLKKSEIIQGIEGLIIAFGLGSIIGPIYTSFAMKFFGHSGYLASYLILTLSLSILTMLLYRKSKREKQIPIEDIITPLVPYNQVDISSILNTQDIKKKS